MSDYDRQFQEDLEKAQALSLESLALDEFRRKAQYNKANAGISRDSAPLANISRRDSEGPPPALPPPPRRPSRQKSLGLDPSRSPGSSPTREDSDLISFSSPTSKTAPTQPQPDPHASLKLFIEQINKQTDESVTPKDQSPVAMNNHFYNQRPGYPYGPYNYPPPHNQMPPYPPATPYPPASPYGMPTPMPTPMPNYQYYSPEYMQPPYAPTTPPYSHTRLATPAATPAATPTPYAGYPPPHYNYSTTNMISRPSRPANMYQPVGQLHTYPGAQSPGGTAAAAPPLKPEPSRNSVESNASNKSELSNASNESNDTVGSLPKSINLIDFGKNAKSGPGSVRVSVLEAFDPLLIEPSRPEYAAPSECSSVYEEYDPLDFLYGETEMRETTIYATVNKRESAVLPSPPPKSIPSVPAVAKRSTTNKLYDCIVKTRSKNYDAEHKDFLKMVLDVRKSFVHTDAATNPGCVLATRSAGRYPRDTSVKVVVQHAAADEPIAFTSDVESTVDHVILTVVCSVDEEVRDMSGYVLRVWGVNEYLQSGTSLSEYDYVRECVRLEKDVRLCLHEDKDRSLARSERDDTRDAHLTLDDLIPTQGAAAMLTFDNLSILLETLEGELSRAIGVTGGEGSCPPGAAFQAVKAVCALAGGVETLHVTHTLNAFAQACAGQSGTNVTPEIGDDRGQYSAVSIRSATARETVALQCNRVRDAVRALVALYTRTQLVDFAIAESHYLTPSDVSKATDSTTITERLLLCVECVHALPPCWAHAEYLAHAQLYHGTRALRAPRVTHAAKAESAGFWPRIIFDTWLSLEDTPINAIPREARLVITLYGRTQRAPEHDAHAPDDDGVQYEQTELGWTAVQLFQYDGMLASGAYALPLWPPRADRRLAPAPHLYHAPPRPYPIVNIEIPMYVHSGVRYARAPAAPAPAAPAPAALPAFDSLDGHTQSQLLHLIEQGAYQRMPTECREILWEKRQYLVQLPGALPLVLLAAADWSGEAREQLVGLVRVWQRPAALDAMHLLLPCFPDETVRALAVGELEALTDAELTRVLPQLVVALRHSAGTALPRLLLRRALAAPRVAHALYWRLASLLPPQSAEQEPLGISLEEAPAAADDGAAVSAWRQVLVLRALRAVCGANLARALHRQQMLVKSLSDMAQSVKAAKDGQRQRALTSGAEQLASLVRAEPAALPLGLHRAVRLVDVKSCSYFSSNTLPLKINFIGLDNAVIPAMFKVGDDLRQDALVLQVMRVMDQLWLQAGLDLRMVTFDALPTSDRRGMIEIVQEAETLRAIQTEWGLTGSFKDKPIAEWLAKHNPSELEYQRARDNFTASCAGYSVATYLLGICDRHNDNIMLKTSGHLFHIDFGKFLGDAQMFGNFKRDRAPFVLTHDMVYVINGGERPTQRFQHFVELCCMAFNVVRARRDHILDLFALMASSNVPGVTHAAVGYVRAALLPAAGNAEAAAAFARLIHSSLKSKFTPINFFLHNLAQLRASGDQGGPSAELLSFMSRTYTMSSEGRLVSVECLGYEKRYDPEKHYVYSLRAFRQGQATPSVLYRSYKHFTELYQKICLHFPLAKVHSLPSGLHVGRSNIRQVAERRFGDVQAFLQSLFSLADEIAHSDLVYTFFHPLLRDQQDVEPQRMKHKEVPEVENSGSGSLKLSVQYKGGVLSVLILHAQSLALTPQGLPPNPYVKVYLVPDPTKETKRKTRVLKRNSHPSFMEMLEYRLPLDIIQTRSLQATVWHYDSLQENQFLGGAVVPLHTLSLRDETVGWYPLEYIPR